MPAVARVSLSSLGEPLFLIQLKMARSKYIMSKQLTDVLDDKIITSTWVWQISPKQAMSIKRTVIIMQEEPLNQTSYIEIPVPPYV